MAEAKNRKQCGDCFFWNRIAHPLDFELGRCELFEREQKEKDVCAMWEGRLSTVAVPKPELKLVE